MLKPCFDCIHFKEPKLVDDLRRFNDLSYCLKYKEYAEKCRENEKKCGLRGKGFERKIKN